WSNVLSVIWVVLDRGLRGQRIASLSNATSLLPFRLDLLAAVHGLLAYVPAQPCRLLCSSRRRSADFGHWLCPALLQLAVHAPYCPIAPHTRKLGARIRSMRR